MVKLSLNSVKYVIEGKFKVNGHIDKNDFIGSLYGQTEGLIGEDLDFNNLFKNGKIGRIEIFLKNLNSNTYGKFSIPTYLNKTEVSLVAAAIESVTKIGHCEGNIEIIKINDVRDEKRKQILSRAEYFLKTLKEENPQSKNISGNIDDSLKTKKIRPYANDKVFALPGIKYKKEIILVEGRADVVNLVKNNIENVVSFNGSNVPKFIIDLCNDKQVTLFLDGDNAGKKEFESLKQKINVKYVAFAPDGKEVEELDLKEITKCLKNKKELGSENIFNKVKNVIKTEKNYRNVKKNLSYITRAEFNQLKKYVKDVNSNKKYKILDESLKNLKEGNISDIFKLKNLEASILIYDGLCEGRLLKKTKEMGIDFIICKKASKSSIENSKIKFFEDFLN